MWRYTTGHSYALGPRDTRALGARGRAWCAAQHGPDVLRGPRLDAVGRMLADA